MTRKKASKVPPAGADVSQLHASVLANVDVQVNATTALYSGTLAAVDILPAVYGAGTRAYAEAVVAALPLGLPAVSDDSKALLRAVWRIRALPRSLFKWHEAR